MLKKRLVALLLTGFWAAPFWISPAPGAALINTERSSSGKRSATARSAKRSPTAAARSKRRRSPRPRPGAAYKRRGKKVRVAAKRGSMIPSGRVLEIQNALIAKGLLSVPASGQYDQTTIEAMRVFQTRENLDSTGYPTAHTLKRLGLTEGPRSHSETVGPQASPR